MVDRMLDGWRVLIPRGGTWGDELAERLRAAGAEPVVAPLIAFEPPEDDEALAAAVTRLGAGAYDWLVLTSATTVAVLASHGIAVPGRTRVAVVGEHTGRAARDAGLRIDFMPAEPSAAGLVAEWPGAAGDRVLLPQSQLADPTLTEGLTAVGAEVDHVTAYRTVPVRSTPELAAEVAAGAFSAILVTAGSVAARVVDEFETIPDATAIVAIGPRTAGEAASAGLAVAQVAQGRSGEAMIEALVELAAERSAS